MALLAAALGGIVLSGNPIHALHSAIFGNLDIFPLLAVPLFIYAGDIMSRGGIARRLIELILSLVGAVRGALGIATVAACEVFSVMSGSSVGLRRGHRQAHHPGAEEERLRRHVLGQPGDGDRRDRRHHAALDHDDHLRDRGAAIGAAAVSRRFPGGILIGIVLSIYVVWYARVKKIPITAPAQRKDILAHLKDSIWALLAPIVILGGIYGGLFTPTEAAGVACIYAIVISMFVYRELTWRELWRHHHRVRPR